MDFSKEQISRVHREIFGLSNAESAAPNSPNTKTSVRDPHSNTRPNSAERSSCTDTELSQTNSCKLNHSVIPHVGDGYPGSSATRAVAPWVPDTRSEVFHIVLKRDPSYGFGILIRRGVFSQRLVLTQNGQFFETRAQALFAEPGPCGVRCGLLPGDRLIAVNDTAVGDLPRNHVIQLIRAAGSEVTLTVQPTPELVELSQRRLVLFPSSNPSDDDDVVGQDAAQMEPRRITVRQHLVEAGGLRNLSEEFSKLTLDMNTKSSGASLLPSNSVSPISIRVAPQNGTGPTNDRDQDSPTRNNSESELHMPVWLSVPDGYKAATLLATLPQNRCRLLLLPERHEAEVDLSDIERANPPSFDHVEDVADLRFPNELSVTHTLLQRFGSGQVCTYASGASLLSINPMTPLNIYTEAVMKLFTGCRHLRDMPPHVFSVAQLVLARLNRSVLKTRTHSRLSASSLQQQQQQQQQSGHRSSGIEDQRVPQSRPVRQAICLSGRSGSGKTRVALDVLSFFLYQSNRVVAQWMSKNEGKSVPATCHRVSAERLRALFCMLDAFTCSRILLNTNANRAMRLFSVEYGSLNPRDRDDPGLYLCGLTTRLVLFERSRVTERPDGEPNFHVFYYFLAGLDEASKRELFLTDANEPNLFMTKLHRPEDKEAARGYWSQLCHDAELLGFNMEEEWLTGGIARLLAIIYHLGCAGCVEDGIVNGSAGAVSANGSMTTTTTTNRGFMYMEPAHRAAYLLNCSVEHLANVVFGMTETDSDYGRLSALDCLRGFVEGIYQTVVDMLVMLLNRCLSSHSTGTSPAQVTAQVLLFDPAGIQAPLPGARASSNSLSAAYATFPDLIMNYANERVGKLFHDTTLGLDEARMLAEGLSVPPAYINSKTAEAMVRLFEDNPDLEPSVENPGIFWILNQAASEGNHNLLLEKLEEIYQTQRIASKNRDLRTIRRLRRSGTFTLNHSLSSMPVEYQPNSRWLVQCRLSPSGHGAVQLLRRFGVSSLKRLISILMMQKDYFGEAHPTWFNNPSVCDEAKNQLDFVIDLLQSCATSNSGPSPHHHPGSGFNDGGPSCGLHWIHCLLPVINAGLCQLTVDPSMVPMQQPNHVATLPAESRNLAPGNLIASSARICVNLIRAQLRGLNLVAMLHAARAAYSDRVSLVEFRRYYELLLPVSVREALNENGIQKKCDDKQFVTELMASLHYPPRSYLVGNSQIFLRSYVLPQLQLRRSAAKTSELRVNTTTSVDQSETEQHTTVTLISSPRSRTDSEAMQTRPCEQATRDFRISISPNRVEVSKSTEAESARDRKEPTSVSVTTSMPPANKNLQQYFEVKAREEQSLREANNESNQATLVSRFRTSDAIDPLQLVNRSDGENGDFSHPSSLHDPAVRVRISTTDAQEHMKRSLNHSVHEVRVEPLQSLGSEQREFQSSMHHTIQQPSVTVHSHTRMNGVDCETVESYRELQYKFKRSQKALEESHAQVERLTAQLKRYERDVVQLQTERSEVETQNTQTHRKLAASERHVDLLKEERDRAVATVTELEQKLARSSCQINALQTQLRESAEKVATLSAALAQQSRSAEQQTTTPTDDRTAADELAELRLARQTLQLRVTELQSELEELRHDVALTEQARSRAEQNLRLLRLQSQQSIEEREAELEDSRVTNQARVRQLEQQLDAAQEECSQAARERLKLEHDLTAANTELMMLRESVDPDTERKLRKELKKFQALLAEKEELCERLLQQPSTEQSAIIKALRDRIDELDEQKETANRQKRALQVELDEAQTQLLASQRIKKELEDQLSAAKREAIDLSIQVEDYQEANKDAQRLHQTYLAGRSVDAATIEAQTQEINDLLKERDALRARVDEMHLKLTTSDMDQVPRTDMERLESKVRELEQRLDLEQTSRLRLQTALDRARETIEQVTAERDKLLASENAERQQNRKLARQLREAQQEQDDAARRALLAQRRADEALTHADQAFRQAASSRVELSAMARRTQELEAWVNERQLDDYFPDLNCLLDDTRHFTSEAGDGLLKRHRSLHGSVEFNHLFSQPKSASPASASTRSSSPRATSPPVVTVITGGDGVRSNS